MPIRDVTFAMLLAALPVAASAMTCPAKLGPAEQIACLQTQNAILKELITSKNLVKKLDGDETKPRQLDLPVVLSIFGVDGRVQAVLSYAGAGGGTITATPGMQIPGGWTVKSIDQGRVTIAKGKVTHLLLLAGAPAASDRPQTGTLSTSAPVQGGAPLAGSTIPPFPVQPPFPAQQVQMPFGAR